MKIRYKILLLTSIITLTAPLSVFAKKDIKLKSKTSIIEGEQEPFEFRKAFDIGAEATTDVIQDGDGFLWFSSSVGLVKYDGYDTKYYRAGPNSISDNTSIIAKTRDIKDLYF